jgi:hypothetical protein
LTVLEYKERMTAKMLLDTVAATADKIKGE